MSKEMRGIDTKMKPILSRIDVFPELVRFDLCPPFRSRVEEAQSFLPFLAESRGLEKCIKANPSSASFAFFSDGRLLDFYLNILFNWIFKTWVFNIKSKSESPKDRTSLFVTN